MNEFTNERNLYPFRKKLFKKNYANLCWKDRPFFDQITEVLDITFFEKKYLQIFAQTLIDYRDKYNTHPNNEVMMTLLRTEVKSS